VRREVGSSSAFGTAVIDGFILRITGVDLAGGRVVFTATARKPDRSVRIGPGALCRIHGRDGSVIAAYRLPSGTDDVLVEPGIFEVTAVLPLGFSEFRGDAAWP
jgi:hypothetical protein